MSERIRYKQVTETTLESYKTFSHASNGAQYIVRLDLKDNQWFLLDANTELVAVSGYITTKPAAQLAVRKALLDFGINIKTEQRNKQQ